MSTPTTSHDDLPEELERIRAQIRDLRDTMGWLDQRDPAKAIEGIVRGYLALCDEVSHLTALVERSLRTHP